MKRRDVLLASAVATASLGLKAAWAQAGFPGKSVRMIIPYTTGQSADTFGRIVATELGNVWPQGIFVDNKGGGASIPGMMAGKTAPPDGYTITLGGSGPLGINPGLYGNKLPYDPLADFAPVHGLFISPLVVVAHPASPINSFQALVAAARRTPGGERWGVAGLGTSPHLAGELIKAKAGLNIVAIPYRGSGPMMSDLLGRQITLGVDTIAAAMPYIKSGRLRGLAVTSAERLSQIPDIPSVAESGYPGFEAAGWGGFVAPAGTPPAAIATLEREIHKVLIDPTVQEQFVQRGAVADTRRAAEFGAFVKAEISKWSELIAANGIKVDQ